MKIPDRPQDIFVPLTQDYLKIFNRELVALIIYGSAAGGSYIRGKSDINLLVVLTPAGLERMADALHTVRAWQKRRVAVPLVMSRDFLLSSLDSYPIEFLNMKNSHIVIYGENILESITIRPEDLRLQIERELRGKLILLRQGYWEAQGRARGLKKLIGGSLTAFISIFNALLFLKGEKSPPERRATIREMGRIFALDTAVFEQCADIKEGANRLSPKAIENVFNRYIREVEKICTLVDRL